MEIKLPSFFVLSQPSHLMENFFNTIFNFNEFVFVYVANIRFICDGKIYLLTYAFDTAEVLKTFKIQQYIGFVVIVELLEVLEVFTVYVRPANIRPTMWDY